MEQGLVVVDIVRHNREAWDRQVAEGNVWTVPVSKREIAEAREGRWQIVLTPAKPVPQDWFPSLSGCEVLALASGGGQQGPILAAVGARVTVFDNSPAQLAQDEAVARRERLSLRTVQGDMRDLSCFSDESFDLIVHPCSNCFVDSILPVWQETYRVLRKGGSLLSGFCNPVTFAVDPVLEKQDVAQFRFKLPYSDLTSLSAEEREEYFPNEPLSFGHTLEDQLGGQLRAGFIITGLYEDNWPVHSSPIHRYMDCFMATRALKP